MQGKKTKNIKNGLTCLKAIGGTSTAPVSLRYSAQTNSGSSYNSDIPSGERKNKNKRVQFYLLKMVCIHIKMFKKKNYFKKTMNIIKGIKLTKEN